MKFFLENIEMQYLSKDLLRLIDSYLEMQDHCKLLQVCVKFRTLDKGYGQWFRNFERRRRISLDIRFLKFMIEKYDFSDFGSLMRSSVECIRFFIENGKYQPNDMLYHVCVLGNIDLINLVIPKADDWNSGLRGACGAGNLEIVQLMVRKGATNLNRGLVVAGSDGHREVCEWLLKNGAGHLNGLVEFACMHDQYAIVRFAFSLGATHCKYCHKSKADHLSPDFIYRED